MINKYIKHLLAQFCQHLFMNVVAFICRTVVTTLARGNGIIGVLFIVCSGRAGVD